MLRRFSRINSVPHYRVEQNKQTGKFEVITITSDYNTSSASSSSICSKIHPEYQYINLIHDILNEKQEHNGRNGSTFSVFGAGMVFSLDQGVIPILTTKRMA